MSHISIFFELTRLKKPIGFMLLFWPCTWGLTIAYDFQNGIDQFIYYMILFFCGSVLMRSAGCIVNDIIDKDFDKNVERTKNRPIASGKITTKLAIIYSIILCLLAFFVLLNFNFLTVLLAIASMPFAFTYPLMKRYTYWPQLFLGFTFNYGLLLGWTAINESLSLIPIIFYFGAIFWTLGYDTIYGFQDIEDDEIIGVKSTSIKFKESPKIFLSICYSLFIFCYLIMGLKLSLNNYFFAGIILAIIHLFFFQILNFDKKDKKKNLNIFKSNNLLGLIVLISILIGKI
ncbi:4-hydroxybenzoate octaprenyltransferase [Candidatus Pelagibacter sp.]|nr:4-hydroxybenzoate octaprenyltransferase [Candidatus Pelagibacter sp.]